MDNNQNYSKNNHAEKTKKCRNSNSKRKNL